MRPHDLDGTASRDHYRRAERGQPESLDSIHQRVRGPEVSGHNLATIRPSDDDRDKAFAETQTLLKVYPNIKVIDRHLGARRSGAAEAVKQSGRQDAKVIGLSLPNLCKPYVHQGFIQAVVLWKTRIWLSDSVGRGGAGARRITRGATSFYAGRLGNVKIEGTDISSLAPRSYSRSKTIDPRIQFLRESAKLPRRGAIQQYAEVEQKI